MPCWSELRVRTLSVGSSSVVGGTSAQRVYMHITHMHTHTHRHTHAWIHSSGRNWHHTRHVVQVCATIGTSEGQIRAAM